MDGAFETREHGLGPDPATVEDIVVLCPGGLTDMVKAVPALRHLRRTYADSRIAVVAHAGALDLLRGCPYVDRCIAAGPAVLTEVGPVDLAISFGDPHAEALVRRRAKLFPELVDVRAHTRVAYRAADDGASLHVHPVWPDRLPATQRMLRLVWLLGGAAPDATLGLWPTLVERNRAAHLLAAIDAPIAVVHPGAGDDLRRWPVEQFARVVDAVALLGLHPVVVGVQCDTRVAARLRGLTTAPWLDLVGATAVGTLVGLIERAALFVGNDSAPAVLASVMGVQSVVIGPASTIEQIGHADRVTYVTSAACSACGDVSCAHALAAAADVPVEAVLSQVVLTATRARHAWQGARIADA